mmetsp:Transcript_16331/g.33233  ORF Transcript_16331/g.33233 Transcript_16331/m.33233 type:complete len:153 (-) Transcript_16331:518-976(-)
MRWSRLCSGLTLAGHLVENAGSTARDHLANERTFLAWSRTGLSFVAAGVGVFGAYHIGSHPDRGVEDARAVLPAVGLLIGNGALVLSTATYRYFRVSDALEKGQYRINKRGLLVIVAATAATTIASGYIIAKPVLIQSSSSTSSPGIKSTTS